MLTESKNVRFVPGDLMLSDFAESESQRDFTS